MGSPAATPPDAAPSPIPSANSTVITATPSPPPPAGGWETEGGEAPGKRLHESGIVPEGGHRAHQGRDQRTHEAEPDPPRERPRQLVAAGAAAGAAGAPERGRGARG